MIKQTSHQLGDLPVDIKYDYLPEERVDIDYPGSPESVDVFEVNVRPNGLSRDNVNIIGFLSYQAIEDIETYILENN